MLKVKFITLTKDNKEYLIQTSLISIILYKQNINKVL